MALEINKLPLRIFKVVVESTPLISIDLCLVCEGKLLLGKRNNHPLKDEWFTPGGRILKNETWENCLERIMISELGLKIKDHSDFKLMGVWDHFYDDSAVSDSISTHYVNLPHYTCLKQKPNLQIDCQHSHFKWFDLEQLLNDVDVHNYIRKYASWLINEGLNND